MGEEPALPRGGHYEEGRAVNDRVSFIVSAFVVSMQIQIPVEEGSRGLAGCG